MIVIAGAGIAGLTMALTCHQLGIRCRVYEATQEIKPLGVGINVQPNAVRELFDLGLADNLAEIGVEAEEWALFARSGQLVWSEPRGILAGYRWPQFSVHRGHLQQMLLKKVQERLGEDAVVPDARLVRYENESDGIRVHFCDHLDRTTTVDASLLVGADGIHSAVRAQMYPDEGAPQWGGAIMWRGTSRARPPRTNNSFILIGTLDHRFVCYPISQPDDEGYVTLNWIAELTPRREMQPAPSDWNRAVSQEEFLPHFLDWDYGWIDVPQIIRDGDVVLEYPMVDRDPVPGWVDGRAVLIGDAAHAMYPVGSNGASQAIVDTRLLGLHLQQSGVGPDSLTRFENQVIEDLNALVLRNRGNGPIGILGIVEEKAHSESSDIHDVISKAEIAEFMARYKEAAGFAVDTLNEAPPTLDIG